MIQRETTMKHYIVLINQSNRFLFMSIDAGLSYFVDHWLSMMNLDIQSVNVMIACQIIVSAQFQASF